VLVTRHKEDTNRPSHHVRRLLVGGDFFRVFWRKLSVLAVTLLAIHRAFTVPLRMLSRDRGP
jgi:hypothetical protein